MREKLSKVVQSIFRTAGMNISEIGPFLKFLIALPGVSKRSLKETLESIRDPETATEDPFNDLFFFTDETRILGKLFHGSAMVETTMEQMMSTEVDGSFEVFLLYS